MCLFIMLLVLVCVVVRDLVFLFGWFAGFSVWCWLCDLVGCFVGLFVLFDMILGLVVMLVFVYRLLVAWSGYFWWCALFLAFVVFVRCGPCC